MRLFSLFLIVTAPVMASKTPTLTTLYNFSPDNQGAYNPSGGLVRSHNGVLYGTAENGGLFHNGVVYSLTPPVPGETQWLFQVLYAFTGLEDGGTPTGMLVLGSEGVIYGTTMRGGVYNAGTVYRLSPRHAGAGPWSETVLYSFPPSAVDFPSSGLTMDLGGNLYGSCGGIFRLSPPATPTGNWTETTLFVFPGGAAGAAAGFAVPLVDATGNLYGTTMSGGVDYGPPYGQLGIIYELSPAQSQGAPWIERVLYSFPNPSAGAQPEAGLIMDAAGSFYGTTSQNVYSVTHGAVFKLTPPATLGQSWTEQVLWSFVGPADGSAQAPLVFDAQGNLYGTTVDYGDLSACAMGCGAVFKLLPPSNPGGAWQAGWNFAFTATNGMTPKGNLVVESGRIYGVTQFGGQYGSGTVFELEQ